MRCIIVDDDELSRRVIEDYINRTDFLLLEQSFGDPIEAINYIRQGNEVNLIFLDVEMPEMSGMEFMTALGVPISVVIISSKEKYALEAFEHSVTDYLLKPVNYSRFFKAVNRSLEKFDKNRTITDGEKEIFVKKNNSLVRVKYNDILYVEALENYVVINTLHDKFTIHFTMKSIEQQLPMSRFKRVHRSFIVNIGQIFSIEDNSVIIKIPEGKRVIPIGKSYRDKLMREINLMNK
jgi:DNA-binding LytR/AlgR family response regulator